MRRGLATLNKAWAMAGVTLLFLLVLEIASFFALRRWEARALPPQEAYWPRSDSYAGTPWIEDYVQEFRQIRTRWEPYVYWRRLPFSGKYITVDAEGLRRTTPGLAAAEGKAPVRISFFGGSTTWSEGVPDGGTIPSQIASLLAARNVAADVVNFGEGGYVSTQELLVLLRRLQQGDVPDIAVFYHGLNDMYSAAQSGEAGIPQNEWNRREEFNVSSRKIQVYQLALVGPRTGLYVVRLLQRLLAREVGAEGPALPDGLAQGVVDAYRANVRAIEALGREYGFTPVFYWQPVLYEKTLRTPFEESLLLTQPARFEPFFAQIDERIRTADWKNEAKEFHYIGDLFAPIATPLYIDFAHISEAGNRLVAEQMVKDLERIIGER